MATQFSITEQKPWKTRFFIIWIGQSFSILGSQLVQFALIWHLTTLTGSATVLATASLVGMFPNIFFGPFVGTLVDRWNRRPVMLAADTIVAIATFFLAIIFSLSLIQIWHIYVVMFIRALAGAFHSNAMNASTSLMVPVEHMTRIQGINQMLDGGLNIVAAPLGALLLGILPIQGILLIDVATALIAILPLLFITVPQPERIDSPHSSQSSVWQDFRAGFLYILNWPGLLLVVAMTMGINFTIIPAFSLLPLLVKNFFAGGALQLSWIQSSMGIGIFAGGALLGIWGGFRRKIFTSLFGLMGMGGGLLLIAFVHADNFLLALCGVFFIGLMLPIMNGPFVAIIQTRGEPQMQARVFSLLQSVGTGVVPLGLLVAGPMADRIGIQSWFLLGGILCVITGLAGFFVPAVVNIESTPL